MARKKSGPSAVSRLRTSRMPTWPISADQAVEPGPPEVLEQRHVDRLGAVVVQLRRDARAIPGPAQVAIQLRHPGGDLPGVGGRVAGPSRSARRVCARARSHVESEVDDASAAIGAAGEIRSCSAERPGRVWATMLSSQSARAPRPPADTTPVVPLPLASRHRGTSSLRTRQPHPGRSPAVNRDTDRIHRRKPIGRGSQPRINL